MFKQGLVCVTLLLFITQVDAKGKKRKAVKLQEKKRKATNLPGKKHRATDLLVFPTSGSLIFKGSYFSSNLKTTNKVKDGPKLLEIDNERSGLDFTLWFAWSRRLALSLHAHELKKNEEKTKTTESKGPTGFADPEASILFRLGDVQNENRHLLLTFRAAPKIRKAEWKLDGSREENYRGGSDFGVKLGLIERKSKSSWFAGLGVDIIGEKEYFLDDDRIRDPVGTYTAYRKYYGEGGLQWIFTDLFSADSYLRLGYREKYKEIVSNNIPGVGERRREEEYGGHLFFSLGGRGHIALASWCTLTLGLELEGAGNYDHTVSGVLAGVEAEKTETERTDLGTKLWTSLSFEF